MSVTKLFSGKGVGLGADLEKQFKDGGIEFMEARCFADMISERSGVGLSPMELDIARQTFSEVQIDLAVPPEADKLFEHTVRVFQRTTGREVYFTNFCFSKIGEQKILSFTAHMPIPALVLGPKRPQMAGEMIATSFLDLCFGGAQEIQAQAPDTTTPLRPGAVYADLGWFMPSRYVDTLIDAMGKLNDTMFDGELKECLIYREI